MQHFLLKEDGVVEDAQNGSCLIVRMKKKPEPSLPVLERAASVLRRAGFDVQAANIDGEIVFAALGSGTGMLARIKEDMPGVWRMEYGTLYSLGYERFQEFHIFIVEEEKVREDRRSAKSVA